MADSASARREARKRRLLLSSEERLKKIIQLNENAKGLDLSTIVGVTNMDCGSSEPAFNKHRFVGSDSDVSVDGPRKQIRTDSVKQVKSMFPGEEQTSRQEQSSTLIIDLLSDIQSRLATFQDKVDRIEQKQSAMETMQGIMDHKQDRLHDMIVGLKAAPDLHSEASFVETPVPAQPSTSTAQSSSLPATPAHAPVPSTSTTTLFPATIGTQSVVSSFSNSLPLPARFVAGPESETFLLGGSETLVRSVVDYNTALHKVQTQRRFATDKQKARFLCIHLLKCEFPRHELARKNLTGNSRDDNNKRCKIPQLDRNIIQSIFIQAQTQFPDFTDWYTDTNCKTVEAMNECCKRARYQLKKVLPIKQEPIDI
ncbi:uncharacterized protein [Asterias amurensis]|uniref:uncharacterized protein isoform X1 n=1 Tax=Asterias amurensis TaxID=7602 RepID=UPI003AB3B3A9